MAQKCVHLAQTWRWKCVHQRVTTHVETVCLLSNRKPDTTVKIGIDMGDYRRIRDEEKAE